MSVVPSGRFSLQPEGDRLGLTIEGSLFGAHRFVFDRLQRVFLRDGQLVCGLDEITGVEVQNSWQGGNLPHSFLLVIARGDAAEHLYTSPDKATVAEMAGTIAAFLGVGVTQREQPFQRSVREALGIGTPNQDGIPPPPLRIVRTVRGVTSIWGILMQLFVGLGLLGVAGWMVYLGDIQTISLVVGGAFVLFGLGLLFSAAFQLRRHFRSGSFQLDPGDPSDLADEDADTRFSPSLGTSRGQVGLLTMVRRTAMLLGVVLFLAGSGVLALMLSGRATDNSAVGYIVGLIFMAAGGFMVWQAIGEIRRWQAIQMSPLFVEAIIDEVRQVGTRQIRYVLSYRYSDPNGARHNGQSHPLRPAEARWWRPLDVAEVRVDQHRLERSMLVGERPIRRSTRDERQVGGDAREPSQWDAGSD